MCPPVIAALPAILAVTSMAGTVASTVVGANAAGQAGEAQAKGSEFQAQQGRRNAEMAQRAAADAEARGAVDANAVRGQGRRVAAAQKVGYAASGIDGSSGSALAVQEDSAAAAELDAQTVKNNAAREAWGYRAQGSQFNQQAAFSDEQAGYDRARGRAGVAGSILGGVASVAQQGANFYGQRNGAPKKVKD